MAHVGDLEATRKTASSRLLDSARYLDGCAALSEEEKERAFYENLADGVRDIADALCPPKEDWPKNVVPFVPKQRA